MVNAHLDTLELELRKLDGVRTVGFTSQHDVLYIQLFVEASAPASTLPFEATRIAQRHSSSPVAVELVRWTNLSAKPQEKGLASIFPQAQLDKQEETYRPSPARFAGSIGGVEPSVGTVALSEDEGYDDPYDIREEPSDYYDISEPEDEVEELEEVSIEITDEIDNSLEHNVEVDLAEEELIEEEAPIAETPLVEIVEIDAEPISEGAHDPLEERRNDDPGIERIALLLVTTSAENDEIEVHLSFDELRTIGRAATNRGLLGAIDATVQAISELTGSNDFHAEWARSLEPGAEHASLVAVGLTNSEGTDTRHGIAGGASPIEAAARATLNALNRTAVLAATQ